MRATGFKEGELEEKMDKRGTGRAKRGRGTRKQKDDEM
jgi:hypothetical protein